MTSNNDLTAFIRNILGTTRLATENGDVTDKQLDEAAGILSTALAVTGKAATQPIGDDRITHLNNDLDTALWLHAEAAWHLQRAEARVLILDLHPGLRAKRDVIGFRWTDPATGEVRTLAPDDVEVVVQRHENADQPVNTCETDADAARRFAGQCIEMQARIDELTAERDKWAARVVAGCEVIEEATLDGQRYLPGVEQLMEDVKAALLGGEPVKMHPQSKPDAVLPTTREQLAEFFGGIRLANGAVVTGYFVEQALDLLKAHEQPRPRRRFPREIYLEAGRPVPGE